MLRWALDIRPGSKWLESKVMRLAPSPDVKDKRQGVVVVAWNRVQPAKPLIKVSTKEAGLAGDAEFCQFAT